MAGKGLRVAAALAVPVISLALLMLFLERPFWRWQGGEGRDRRAAIAIRDDVIAFQKWGSRAFTEPYLDRYYGSVTYLTQTSQYDKRKEFQVAVIDATASHDAVDIFLLAHSNYFVDWVRELPSESRSKLRLVYNTGCDDASQGPKWLDAGADAYVAHRGVSMSPVFYVYFLRRWTGGESIAESMAVSNELTSRFIGYGSVAGVDEALLRRTRAGTEAICVGDATLRIDR